MNVAGKSGQTNVAATRSLRDPFEDVVTEANLMRGTSPDAPRVTRLLDVVAILAPNDRFGQALYKWAEEVTRLVEGR